MQKPLQMGLTNRESIASRSAGSRRWSALPSTRPRAGVPAAGLVFSRATALGPIAPVSRSRGLPGEPSCARGARGPRGARNPVECWNQDPRNLRDMAWPDANGAVIGAPGGGCD